jgi:hypothetical protein
MVLGDDVEMQVRMEPVAGNASANTATAMNIGDYIVGVYAKENIPLVVNGTAVVLAKGESLAVGNGSVWRDPRSSDELGQRDIYIVMDDAGNGFWVQVFDGVLNVSPSSPTTPPSPACSAIWTGFATTTSRFATAPSST